MESSLRGSNAKLRLAEPAPRGGRCPERFRRLIDKPILEHLTELSGADATARCWSG
jgi:hypothetical protein